MPVPSQVLKIASAISPPNQPNIGPPSSSPPHESYPNIVQTTHGPQLQDPKTGKFLPNLKYPFSQEFPALSEFDVEKPFPTASNTGTSTPSVNIPGKTFDVPKIIPPLLEAQLEKARRELKYFPKLLAAEEDRLIRQFMAVQTPQGAPAEKSKIELPSTSAIGNIIKALVNLARGAPVVSGPVQLAGIAITAGERVGTFIGQEILAPIILEQLKASGSIEDLLHRLQGIQQIGALEWTDP